MSIGRKGPSGVPAVAVHTRCRVPRSFTSLSRKQAPMEEKDVLVELHDHRTFKAPFEILGPRRIVEGNVFLSQDELWLRPCSICPIF